MRYFSNSDVFSNFDVEIFDWNSTFFDIGRLEILRGLALNSVKSFKGNNEFPSGFFSSVDIGLGGFNVSDSNFALEVFTSVLSADGPLSNTIPGDTSTTAILAVGAQIASAIDFAGDTDWFEITLVAGTTYDISMLGNGDGLIDPLVRIMSAAGAELANNDDIILGDFRDSLLTFTAAESGAFYISAEAWSDNTGSYTLSLSEANTGDVAASTATTASISLNSSISGTIETVGDADWYSITLTAGSRYIISNTGFGNTVLSDAFLDLRDSAGNIITSDDDSGPDANARLAYVIETTGTYYISASAFGSATGDYALSVEEVPNLETRDLDGIANFLTDEFSARQSYNDGSAGPTVINFSFASGANSLSAGAEALARRALDAWASVANIIFVEGPGDIVFRNDGDGAFNANTRSGSLVVSSDLNVSSTWNGGSVSLDSYTYQTFLHEIGHALGLGHAGPYNGDAIYNLDNAYLNDSWAYTVMSYFDQNESGYFGDLRFVLGPQIADIIAIQDLYGANTSTRGGDTVYGFNSTETDVHDFNQFSRAPSLSIYDTGGIDTLDFSGYSSAQRIDLRQEAFSDIDGISGAITIARGTVIENAKGGSGVDTIIGNGADNVLTGNGGNDILDGGAGTDYAVFSGAASAYTITFNADGTVTVAHNGGADGTDTLSKIEFARFSDGDVALGASVPTFTENDDTYTGTARSETLDGLGGNDIIDGAGGNDTVNGNDGNDTLTGGAGDDTVNGGAGGDILFGGDGDDILDGGDYISLTPQQAQIYRLYGATLDREPDSGGLENWASELAGGATLEEITSGFINSAEFANVYGALDDTAFVTLLYNNVLNRTPDAGGLATWVDRLSTGSSRENVVNGFSESAEYKNNTNFDAINYAQDTIYLPHLGEIYRLYGATLDREPDSGGFQHWIDQLDDGATLEEITSGFINSAEFESVYGALDDTAFVTLLYNNVLNRAPDAGGLATWVDRLSTGSSRENVVNGFSESAEFKNNTSSSLETFMRDYTAWANTLDGGVGNDILLGGRGSDTFVFDASQDGADTLYGLQSWDFLDFKGFGYNSFLDMTAHLTQNGDNVVFNDQGVVITFVDTVIADINADMVRLIDVSVQDNFSYKQLSEISGSSEVDDTIEMLEVDARSEIVEQMSTTKEVFSEIFEEVEPFFSHEYIDGIDFWL